jgi:hypothetical protein
VNRQDAKGAKIIKAQTVTKSRIRPVPRGDLGDSALKSNPDGLGGPGWRLGGKTLFSDQG